MCHDENRFARDVKPLCNYLESCEELTEVDLHSLLVASLLGPLLDTCSSEKIHVAHLEAFRSLPHTGGVAALMGNHFSAVGRQLQAAL